MSPNNSFKLSRDKEIFLLFLGFLPKHLHCFQPSTEGDQLYFKHCRSEIPELISLFGHNGALTDQLLCMKGRCFTEKRPTALFFNLPTAEARSLRWYPAWLSPRVRWVHAMPKPQLAWQGSSSPLSGENIKLQRSRISGQWGASHRSSGSIMCPILLLRNKRHKILLRL